jgi:hypothetical protein
MNDPHEDLRERMPEVALGADQWSAAEAAHLAGCPDCSAEWRMIQTAQRLGQAAAGRVDPARLGAAVLAGVARERKVLRWKRAGWVTGLAAAAVLTLLVWPGGPERAAPSESASAEYRLPLAELESLDEQQLQAVLEALDAPLGDGGSAGGPSLGDLDDTQLERVLRSLEG